MENIAYDKMFSLLDQEDILFFEDDFQLIGPDKEKEFKSAIVYSIVRMNKNARQNMLDEIGTIDARFVEQVEAIVETFEPVVCRIENGKVDECIVQYDFESAFEVMPTELGESRSVYDALNCSELSDQVCNILSFYGVGVVHPTVFRDLFKDYIFRNNEFKNYKVILKYSEEQKGLLKRYLESKSDCVLVCIIDNQLGREPRAKEICEDLQQYIKNNCQIIGCILSSTTSEESINKELYLENVNKREIEKLQSAIARSAYSYILRKLQKTYQKVMGEAFNDAVQNKNIAFYLSCMADKEGISSYEVITEWINLLFNYKMSDNADIYEMIRITKLINLLEDDSSIVPPEMTKLNTFETYDYNINKYFEPIASGDIFLIGSGKKEKMYMLVGQDCEMMFTPKRPVRTGISELISIEECAQTDTLKEIQQNREYIRIPNFRKSLEENASILKIKYTSRSFIDSQILHLCQFMEDGCSRISLTEQIVDNNRIMPDYYFEIYESAQRYFNAVKGLKDRGAELFDVVLKDEQSPREIYLSEYDEIDGVMEYSVRRICRLKNPYALFVYKMYLDYRGRHPFGTINLAGNHEVEVALADHQDYKLHFLVVLSTDRDVNRKDKRRLKWIVKKAELNRLLKVLWGPEEVCDELEEDICLESIENPYQNDVKLKNNNKLRITKMREKVKMEIIKA